MTTQEHNNKRYLLFDAARTRCGYDNEKVGKGTPTLSTMPGDAASLEKGAARKVLELYADYIADAGATHCTTCTHTCPGCYAMKLKAYPAVMEKYLLNTIECFLNPEKFYALVERELYNNPFTAPRAVRMHEAGEFTTEKEINCFIEFAKRHPETIFFGYTKDARIQKKQLENTLPHNVKFACSPWILADGTVLCAPVGNIYQFIFNDGTDAGRDNITRCYCSNPDGSVNKGATCVNCGRCIRCKDGDRTAVYPHGVALTDTWLAGRTRLYMQAGADYTDAARAAYNDALKLSVPAWKEKAIADIEKRVKKLADAVKKADKKAARA